VEERRKAHNTLENINGRDHLGDLAVDEVMKMGIKE
jgi:hypothetical protein